MPAWSNMRCAIPPHPPLPGACLARQQGLPLGPKTSLEFGLVEKVPPSISAPKNHANLTQIVDSREVDRKKSQGGRCSGRDFGDFLNSNGEISTNWAERSPSPSMARSTHPEIVTWPASPCCCGGCLFVFSLRTRSADSNTASVHLAKPGGEAHPQRRSRIPSGACFAHPRSTSEAPTRALAAAREAGQTFDKHDDPPARVFGQV